MSTPITHSQSVAFDLSNAEVGGDLILELDPGFIFSGGFKVRLYPNVLAQLSTTYGTATHTLTTRVRNVRRELIRFDNSDSGTTKYPITSLTYLEILGTVFALRDGGWVNISSELTPIDFLVTIGSQEIKASFVFTGAIVVGYTSNYTILEYRPEITDIGGLITQIRTVRYGSIYAFYEGRSGSIEIEPPDRESNRRSQLYIAYSTYVADADIGGWETPPNWPNDSSYPFAFPDGEPDPDASATRERPHKLATYNTFGTIFVDSYFVNILKPYTGSFTYHPKVWVRFTPTPAIDSDFYNGYQRAIENKSEILAALDSEFPEFQGEG